MALSKGGVRVKATGSTATSSASAKAQSKARKPKQRPALTLPFSYFWLKEVIKEFVTYKNFPDALAATFAFVSLTLAFHFYPLIAIMPFAILIFALAMLHPLIGLMALLFFSYPPIIYQTPLLAWIFGLFVAASLFVGFVHYRTVTFLFTMVMLALSPLGLILELPLFVLSILVLGFKRSALATLFGFILIITFTGLTGIPVYAPIAYNSSFANAKFVVGSAASTYLMPSKPLPSLENFSSAFSQSVSAFFSMPVASDLSNAFELAGVVFSYMLPATLLQLLVWIIIAFVITNFVIKSRSAFKGTEASFFSVAILILYFVLGYMFNIRLAAFPFVLSFLVTPAFLFALESQNIEVVKVLDVMKQDILGKFGALATDMATPKETFDDVADYDNIKQELNDAVLAPIERKDIAGAYGVKPAKGILLFGPPGTGKTLIMRALANEIRAGFYYISAPSLITAYPGESGQALVKIFETAKKNAPAILFIDEIDAIARKRSEESTEPLRELLTTLLTEMDGFLKTPGVVVVGATNAPDLLDPALLRPGRFDRAIYMTLPDQKGREAILKYYFSKLPIASDIDYEKLAELTIRFSGADIKHLADETARVVSEEAISSKKILQITMQDILNILKKIKPSTSLSDIERYNSFQMEFERALHPEKAVEEAANKVSVEDVVDLEEAKKALFEAVEVPILHPDLVKKYQIESVKGILLFGPPGTGKTMLMSAISNELGDVHFFTLSGFDLSKAGLENAVTTIRNLFNKAKENSPSIVFIDEIDALVPQRDTTTEIGTQLVGQFLEEFDSLRLQGTQVVVVAATNRPDALDPALLRSGRFDRLIFIPPPELNDRIELFKKYLSGAPLSDDIDYNKLASSTNGFTGADIANICRQAKMNALEESISKGEEVKITMQALMALVLNTRPSAPSNVMGRYLMFLSRYGKR